MEATTEIEKKEPITPEKKEPIVETTKPVAVKAGVPVAAAFTPQPAAGAAADEPGNMGGSAAAAAKTETDAEKEARLKTEAAAKGPEVTEDAVKLYLESIGVKVGSLDEVKKKFETPAAELTAEEIKAAESQMEQRMVAKFVAGGGTIEQYAAMKQVDGMDAKELGKSSTRDELKGLGFDEKEIDNIIKERYYQIAAEEIVQGEEETVAEFEARKKSTEKKIEAFAKKLDIKGSRIKQDAATFINTLRDAVKSEDSQKVTETKFLSNVDESLKKLPRELTLELGLVNDQKVDPVPFKVTDEHIASVKDILNDPAKRKQYFINADITQEDLGRAVNNILRIVAFESMSRAAFLEGGTREVNKFKKVFPDNPNTIGVGGAPKKVEGKIAKAGEPVWMQPKGVQQ